MNRRQLLRTLAVLSASGSTAALLKSVSADRPELAVETDSLTDLLTHSRRMCDLVLEELAQKELPREEIVVSSPAAAKDTAVAKDTAAGLKELSALIQQAMIRVHGKGSQAAAFWQTCSDAFSRTARQLTADRSGRMTSAEKAHALFLRAAERLSAETWRLIGDAAM